MRYGFTEEQVLDMPLDRYKIYLEASQEERRATRRDFVVDVASAINGLFSKKGVQEYIDSSLSGEV